MTTIVDDRYINAMISGDFKTARTLKEKIDQSTRDRVNFAFRASAKKGDLETLKIRRDCGANDYDNAALLAAETGRVEILKQLFEWGLSDKILNKLPAIAARYNQLAVVELCYYDFGLKDLNTAIAVSASINSNDSEIVRFCVSHGADANIALACAAGNRNFPIVKILIEKLGATSVDWAMEKAVLDNYNIDQGMIAYLHEKGAKQIDWREMQLI